MFTDARNELTEDGDEADIGADCVTRLTDQTDIVANIRAETVLQGCQDRFTVIILNLNELGCSMSEIEVVINYKIPLKFIKHNFNS